MERLRLAIGAGPPEQHFGLVFRRRGESEEAEIWLFAAALHLTHYASEFVRIVVFIQTMLGGIGHRFFF